MSTEKVAAFGFHPIGQEHKAPVLGCAQEASPLEGIPFRKTSAPCHETPPGPTSHTIRHIYFLDLLLLHCDHKSKAKKQLSDLILFFPGNSKSSGL